MRNENYELALVKDVTAPVVGEDNELLVFFMPDGKSIVKNMPGVTKQVDPSSDGWTPTGTKICASEVYVRYTNAVLLAKLAFHEFMHNKLNIDDRMHYSQDGLGQKIIGPETQLSRKNILTMQGVIKKGRPQWWDGITRLINMTHDPLTPEYHL